MISRVAKLYFAILLVACSTFWGVACSGQKQFSDYQRELIGEVKIGEKVTKEIVIQNTSLTETHHIEALNFDAANNTAGHFRIEKVEVGGVPQNPKDHDISVPPASMVQIYVTYQPLNLETTISNAGGWSTGQKKRYIPSAPKEKSSATKAMSGMLSAKGVESEIDTEGKAVHRAVIAVLYDQPRVGILKIEVLGTAEEGPNGETTAVGSGGGSCPDGTGIICYSGGFAIELPDIMTGGARQLKLSGPIVFESSGSNLTLDMTAFPSALLVMKGNGPGEPLEGQPISAISLVISGAEGIEASGTFDGSNIDVNGVAFRIRVVLGELKESDVNPGLQSTVDFAVKDISIKTSKPLTNGSITLTAEAVLDKDPSGNPAFDQVLGNTRVVVTMDGSLEVK